MKTIKTLFLLIALSLLSCSKEDDSSSPNENGGTIYRYQIVTIDMPNEEINQNEYNATLGNLPVVVIKKDDHQLVFGVPEEIAIGNAELVIPGLNNKKVKYSIVEPQLELTPDETIEDLFTLGTTYFNGILQPNTIDNEAQSVFEQFQSYYENLSPTEKETVALYYQVNKQVIDNVLLFNGDTISGRFTSGDVVVITKFCLAAAATVGGGIAVRYGDISLKLLGVVIAKIGHSKAIDYHDELQARGIKVVYLSANGILGENNRSAQSNEVTLVNNIETTMSFQLIEQPLTQNDSNNSNKDISRFFSGQSLYNNFIQNVNSAIQWINNFSIFSIPTIGLATLSSNPPVINSDVTTAAMQDISFTVNHPNLELVTASLQSDGQLKLKVKFIGNPATTPILSTLNYIYDDGLSSFSGSFPIHVQEEVNLLIGNWILIGVSRGTDTSYTPVGQSSEPFNGIGYGFSQQYYIAMPGNATFTPTSFTINTSLSTVTEGMIYTNPPRLCDVTNTYNESYTLDNYSYPEITINNYIEITNINSTHNSTKNDNCDNGENNTFTYSSNSISLRKIKLENENTFIFENTGNSITRYKFARQ